MLRYHDCLPQTFQNPPIKEYLLNRKRIQGLIQGSLICVKAVKVYPLIWGISEGLPALLVVSAPQYMETVGAGLGTSGPSKAAVPKRNIRIRGLGFGV